MGILNTSEWKPDVKAGLVELLISYQETTELWEAKWQKDTEGGQANFMSVLVQGLFCEFVLLSFN